VEVGFENQSLAALEAVAGESHGWNADVIRKFQQRLQFIRAAPDERDFYAMRSLHYEKLKGNRKHQRSMRLTKKWRLILELRRDGDRKVVHIVGIEDYH